jgi:hypothetical protein
VLKIRCDAGSTENDAGIANWLATEHGVTIDPAAVGKQNQNPVEREVQTLIKGVGCLLLDQDSLSSKWWCYAVQSWVQTANCRPNTNPAIENSTSPIELITGVAPDIESKFLFPFGCPVTFITPTGRDQHFSPSSKKGIAVGTTEGSNGATLVLVPGRGLKSFPRADVQRLDLPPTSPTPITEELLPAITAQSDLDDETMITFHSPPSTESYDLMSEEKPVGTLGFSIFPLVPSKTQPIDTSFVK